MIKFQGLTDSALFVNLNKSEQIEHESHFLIYRDEHSVLEDDFYRNIENIVPSCKQLPPLKAISELMICFDPRNILLSNKTDVTFSLYHNVIRYIHENHNCFSFSLQKLL